MPVKTKPKVVDENLIPQNIEAEEAILGAILVNPACLSKVSDTIRSSYFYKPAHKYIYEAMDFNYSVMCNTGAGAAKGKYLLFMNDDVDAITDGFMEKLLI